MALSSRFAINIDLLLTDTGVDSTTVAAPRQVRDTVRMLVSGTAVGQADKAWWDTRALTTGASEDLDLAGVLIDPVLKTAMTFVKVKGLYLRAADANTTALTFGANVANGWAGLIGPTGASGGTVTLRGGDGALFVCGAANNTAWAVTAGTGDLLHVVNAAGATANYDIIVVGTSA